MGEKDDGLGLGLSLSLGGFQQSHHHHQQQQQQQPSLHLNLMHSSASSSQFMQQQQQQNHHHHHHEVIPSSDRSSATRTYLRGIDMNEAIPPPPAADCCDDDAGVSSPNSTISSVSGKRSEREANDNNNNNNNNGDDNDASCSRGISDDEDGGDGDGGRKKLRLSKEQSVVLEETFKEHSTLNPKQKLALAKQLTLRPRQVEVWFQNRRARTKLKQTEVDCEYLKRCCENLTEENRRLQKEVQELRALKLSPQFYMNMNPPTTLTMCPSCERVAVTSSSSSAAAAASNGAATAGGSSRQGISTLSNTRPHNPSGTLIQRPVPINAWASKQMQAPPRS